MDKIIPIKLRLYEATDSGMNFNTNLGVNITICKYVKGNAYMETPKGISIEKMARIVSACFLPGSSFTKKGSMFSEFSSISFHFNDVLVEVTQQNSQVDDIVNQFFTNLDKKLYGYF